MRPGSSGATSMAGLRFDLKDRAAAEREALRAGRAGCDGARTRDRAGRARSLGADPAHRRAGRRRAGRRCRCMAMRADGGAPAQTPISPGEIEIRAQVTLTVEDRARAAALAQHDLVERRLRRPAFFAIGTASSAVRLIAASSAFVTGRSDSCSGSGDSISSVALHAELPESARAGQHLLFERADEPVVGVARLLDVPAHRFEVRRPSSEAARRARGRSAGSLRRSARPAPAASPSATAFSKRQQRHRRRRNHAQARPPDRAASAPVRTRRRAAARAAGTSRRTPATAWNCCQYSLAPSARM